MQASLNRYRLNDLKLFRSQARAKGGRIARSVVDATEKSNSYDNEINTNNPHMNLMPRYSILSIQCKPVDRFSVPNLQCVLRQRNMSPNYCIHQEEMATKTDNFYKISFYLFNNLHWCSKHGLLFDKKNGTCAQRIKMG